MELRVSRAKNDFYNRVAQAGYTLIGEYAGSGIKVDLLCDKKHNCAISPGNFKNGCRCTICRRNSRDHSAKAFIENVAKRGFKLVGVYVNSKTKTLVICPIGHEWNVTPSGFYKAKNCPFCLLVSEQDFIDTLISAGYTLVGKYIDTQTRVAICCPKGDTYIVTPKYFRAGKRCGICSLNNPEKAKASFYAIVKIAGYTLLSEYINVRKLTLMLFAH